MANRSETSRFVFTTTRLQKLPPPPKSRMYHHDAKVAGLCLCCTKAGTSTFYFYRWTNGKPARIRLGKFPDLSIDQARKAAKELAGDIARGHDPQAARRARREEPTLGDLFIFWMETYAKVHKKTWAEDERLYRNFLEPWGKRRLSTIRKAEVQTLHGQIGSQNGRYAANRVLTYLRAMFNRAADIGYSGANPTIGIKQFREQSRDRFLQADELHRFFQALSEELNDSIRDFFYLALLTGARRGNLQAMRWDDVNLEVCVWRIPDSKSGEPVVLPLVEPAVKILQGRLQASGGSPWVFPGRGKTGHIVEPKSAWRRILNRAELGNLRLHDLRRTLGSWQAAGGASLPIIGASLGHKSIRSTEVYSRLALAPIRESVERATTAMYEAGDVRLLEAGGEVLNVSSQEKK